MKLFLVSRTKSVGWDEMRAIVVCALDAADARELAAHWYGCEGPESWLNGSRSTVVELVGDERGMILRAFKVG